MGLQLVHRTNYRGKALCGRRGDADTGDLELLWAQAVRPSDDDGSAAPCCRRFGRRSVWITADMLRGLHAGVWELWFVGSEDGRSEGHTFHKLVLMPEQEDEATTECWYTDSDSDQYCVERERHEFPYGWRERWELLAAGRFRKALGALDAALPAFFAQERREGGPDVAHCHVGILLPCPLRVD